MESGSFYYKAPCGILSLKIENAHLIMCKWDDNIAGLTHINGKLRRVLDAYFKTGKLDYDFPIELRGSEFQKAVWEKTKTVAPGATMSYSQLAALCGCPKASRAVAGALHRNPVCIFIPCHRIIGANGSLTGYAGGLDKKSFLLELEGATKNLLHCSY